MSARKKPQPLPSPDFEQAAWKDGFLNVAGIDEAGRGPLAGPVVAAAVVVNPDFLERHFCSRFPGLTDSKKLTPRQRDEFFSLLLETPEVRYGVGQAEVGEIDRLNILRATHLAMQRAAEALEGGTDFLLIDGNPVPGLRWPSRSIVQGDARCLSIAAASIIAKVTRDRFMDKLDRAFPNYGFARHKGYGTAAHLSALQKWGPCPEHRRSFAPVTQLTLGL